MSADSDALLGAIQTFILEGHSFQFQPTKHAMTGEVVVQGTMSGPTGSRSTIQPTVAAVMEALVVAVVSARLAGEIPSTVSPRELLKRGFIG